jgi:hypothetical protein
MHPVKVAALLGGTLIATPAFAQDPPPVVEGEASAGATTEGATMEGTATTTTDANAAIVGGTAFWPQAAVDRPFMRPKGKITAGGDFNLLRISGEMGEGLTLDYITLNAAYGITDQINVGLLYAVTLGLGDGDAEFVGPLSLWGGYQIKHDVKMSVAATGAFAVDLDNTDNMGIGLGLGFRYMVTPKIGVFTGGPYGPGPVGGGGFGGGPLGGLFGPGGHLNISLADNGPITFDIPVGAMFQATPQLAIHAMTGLASIALSNSPYTDDMGEEKSAIIFGADYIPLSIGGLFAVNEMIDVVANFNLPDLKEAQFDLYIFSIGARAHL